MTETGQLGVFASLADMVRAGREARERHYRIDAAYSPFRITETEELMGLKDSPVRPLTLIGGILGGVGLIVLAIWAHLSFSLITGGKPILPVVPWIVVCFEGTILVGSLASFFSWILMGRMPRISLPEGYDERFSTDRFGLLVRGDESHREDIRNLLLTAGAEEVRHVG